MRSPYALLAVAVACVSVGSIFIRLAQAPALAVASWRITLASLLLAPFAASAARTEWPRLGARHRGLLVASGVALGLHFATWIASLSYTTVAASVLLVNTAPLFTIAFARSFLQETITPRVALATAVALAGATAIAAGDWTGSPGSLTGVLLALAGAVTLSVYHVVGRGLRDVLPLPAYVLGVWSTASAVLLALALGTGTPLLGYSGRAFLAFAGLALIPTLAGHGLANRSLRHLPAPTVGLFLLGEPVGASILAYLLFGEQPGPLTLGGGVVVLIALGLIVTERRG